MQLFSKEGWDKKETNYYSEMFAELIFMLMYKLEVEYKLDESLD